MEFCNTDFNHPCLYMSTVALLNAISAIKCIKVHLIALIEIFVFLSHFISYPIPSLER